MELRQLACFVRVAELGSFSQAAMALGLAQPSLSRQIRSLEVELKVHLFRRNGRGAQLTDAGGRLLDHARGVLRGVDSAMEAVKGDTEHSGKVVLGLPPSVGKVLIRPYVARFAREFPQASLGVVEGLSGALHEKLLAGRLDLAVLLNPSASPYLHIEPVVTEALYLVGSSPAGRGRRRLELRDISRLPLIVPAAPHPIRSMLESEAARAGLSLRIAFEIDAVVPAMDLVADGWGYSVVPKNMMRADVDPARFSWQRIGSRQLTTTLCIVTPSRGPRGVLADAATALAKDVLRDTLRNPDEPTLGSGSSRTPVR